ncbi:MAG: MFS transporter [Alphaproteobacteria bacterium]
MRLSARGLVFAMCAAEVLAMLGFSAFPALLPFFRELWGLSNTEAGWISGVFFAGYTAAVPVLVTLTDRVDPKRIWLFSAVVTVVAYLGFALLADGFWSAMLFQALAGVGLAGTYMPGLRALSDQVGGTQSRAVAFYTSAFGIGTASSFPIAHWLAGGFGWQWAFALPGIAAILGILLILAVLPWAPPRPAAAPSGALLDFRPVLRNRSALAYSLCYLFHSWELFGLRTWIVAFLVFTEGLHGSGWVAAPMIAFALTLLGVPSSVIGNEASMRFGRRRTIVVVMTLSAALCFAIGFAASIGWWLVALLALVQGVTVAGESASVTAGAIGNATPGHRGATMALHSMLGFAGGFIGPLAFGLALDLAGGDGVAAWGFAFAHMGVVMLLGPLVIRLLRPAELAGDGRRTPQGAG